MITVILINSNEISHSRWTSSLQSVCVSRVARRIAGLSDSRPPLGEILCVTGFSAFAARVRGAHPRRRGFLHILSTSIQTTVISF